MIIILDTNRRYRPRWVARAVHEKIRSKKGFPPLISPIVLAPCRRQRNPAIPSLAHSSVTLDTRWMAFLPVATGIANLADGLPCQAAYIAYPLGGAADRCAPTMLRHMAGPLVRRMMWCVGCCRICKDWEGSMTPPVQYPLVPRLP